MKKISPPPSAGRRAVQRLAALTALAASAVLLTACGGGKAGAGAPAPTTASAATRTPSPKATPVPAEPYTLTTDAHVAPGQAVGGRYRLARLLGTSGMDVCVDSLLGPTPKYADGAQAAHKNQAAYEAASNKVWAMLARGTKSLDLNDDPHYLTFLNDLSHAANGGAGAISCQVDLRTDLTAYHRDGKTGAAVSDGVQEIACLGSVTASTKSADQLTKEDPGFFGRTPDGRETAHVEPTETVRADGLNYFLVSTCTSGGIPPADFGAGNYKRAATDSTTATHNLLAAMRRHLTP